jgi:hypothetical protein
LSTVTQLGEFASGPADGSCVTLQGGGTRSAGLPISAGVTRIEVAPGPRAAFSLRRLAAGVYPVRTEGAPGGSVTMLRIPRDSAKLPWHLHVDASQLARVCPPPAS